MVLAGRKQGWEMYDCGCVTNRPVNSNYYATRWKVYRSSSYVILKCRDCGRMNYFSLSKSTVQIIKYSKR